jgi:hypothetical protein
VFLRERVERERPADGGEALAPLCSRQPMASVSETAEPLGALGLRYRCPCPDPLSTLAAPRASSTEVIHQFLPVSLLPWDNGKRRTGKGVPQGC